MAERQDYRVVMARVGLVRQPPPVLIKGVDLADEDVRDQVAELLFQRFKSLMTHDGFTVTVNFTTGQVLVNRGEMGAGRLERA